MKNQLKKIKRKIKSLSSKENEGVFTDMGSSWRLKDDINTILKGMEDNNISATDVREEVGIVVQHYLKRGKEDERKSDLYADFKHNTGYIAAFELMERFGFSMDERRTLAPEIVEKRKDSLRKKRPIGYDIVRESFSLVELLHSLEEEGSTISELSNVDGRMFWTQEKAPTDYFYGHGVALKVIGKDTANTQEEAGSRGLYVGNYKGRWVLFEMKEMPLRINERTHETTREDHRILGHYTK